MEIPVLPKGLYHSTKLYSMLKDHTSNIHGRENFISGWCISLNRSDTSRHLVEL